MFDQDQIGEVTLALCSGLTELVFKGGGDTEQAEEGVTDVSDKCRRYVDDPNIGCF